MSYLYNLHYKSEDPHRQLNEWCTSDADDDDVFAIWSASSAKSQ